MYPEEKKNESENETKPPFIFRTTLISENRCDFCLYSYKKIKEYCRSINGYKQTISAPEKLKKKGYHDILSLPERNNESKKCSPIPQNVFLLNLNDLKAK